MHPLVDLPEEQFGSSGNENDLHSSSKMQEESKSESKIDLLSSDSDEVHLSADQDITSNEVMTEAIAKDKTLTNKCGSEAKPRHDKSVTAKKQTVLGKRKLPPQNMHSLLDSKDNLVNKAVTEGRRYSQEEAAINNEADK